MQEIQYLGEHLWVQYLGKSLVIIAFLSAIYTSILSIQLGTNNRTGQSYLFWNKLGFRIHVVSLISIIGLILFMMLYKMYEYQYVWEHVSDDLPLKYILSAFWEGQEGSFLLWMFWNIVLCLLLIRKKDEFTDLNIGIIMAVQAILVSMILGLYCFDFKIGSNPFVLLRQTMDIPLFKNPEYVNLIKGNGMNPLLQNYWMLIHPPTLFFGFASTIVPFAYVLSALITNKFQEWLRPCLRWSLMSASILGLGILMGGIWAYEALSFGGYWAWDPVENMSLVPWLVLIAGLHTHLIAKATQYSVRSSMIFYILSYSLVIYSTYLTRSGVLGDTSVHAFTGLGLGFQLVGFIVLTILIPLYFFGIKYKKIPSLSEEEQIQSREFWMFIGSLILLFSAVLISFTTSIPVYNKVLNSIGSWTGVDMSSLLRSAPVDVVAHHNKFQLWIAVIVCILSGMSLFLMYLRDKPIKLGRNFLKPIVSSIILSSLCAYWIGLYLDRKNEAVYVLLFSSLFAIFTNIYYIYRSIVWKNKNFSSALSHLGFGILIMGIILTGLNRRNIVPDKFFQEDELFNAESNNINKHFLLFKDDPKFASGYWIRYQKDTLEGRFRKYTVNLSKVDSANKELGRIILYPDVQYDNKMTKVAAANPYIKHYWNKDLFSLIAQIPLTQTDAEELKKAEDSLRYELFSLHLNDTVFNDKYYYILSDLNPHWKPAVRDTNDDIFGVQAVIEVGEIKEGTKGVIKPAVAYGLENSYRYPDQHEKFGARIEIVDSALYLWTRKLADTKPTKISLKNGEQKELVSGLFVSLSGFNKNPSSHSYDPIPGDIAVGANLEIRFQDHQESIMPIYIIRDQKELTPAEINYAMGVAVRFVHIDPNSELMDFEISHISKPDWIPVRIAENYPRTDYVVMEIIEFPGINLVWLGSLLMIFGLALAAYFRRKI